MMKQHSNAAHVCAEVPDFERLNYFYGQMLGAADFRSEQAYFREKLKLHNRCLHGYGVVCGLEITPYAEEGCCPPEDKEDQEAVRDELRRLEEEISALQDKLEAEGLQDKERKAILKEIAKLREKREALRRTQEGHDRPNPDGSAACEDEKPSAKILVQCGLALDCHGNEIVLRQAVLIDLMALLTKTDRRRLDEACGGTVYLSICYCGEPTHPTRPVVPDSCGAISDCNFGKTRESVRFSAAIEAPEPDERCETCCTGCCHDCVLLAAIEWRPGSAIDAESIDNSQRRAIGLYEPTVITGVSWEHGRTYSPGEAKGVIGTQGDSSRTNGIEIAFSRPVYAQSLSPGVIDIWRVQGGRGLRGMISNVEGSYVDKPDSGMITSVFYRDDSGETLNSGDRLILIVRGDFILDHCCRPLDGNHVGGRIPQLGSYRCAEPESDPAYVAQYSKGPDPKQQVPDEPYEETDAPAPCRLPPGGIGPWTSGNGAAGGTFESWIYID